MAQVVLSYIVAKLPRENVIKGFFLYMFISGAGVLVGPMWEEFFWNGRIGVGRCGFDEPFAPGYFSCAW